MADYREIPGRPDLFWGQEDGSPFFNLHGIGSTGRRAARLGAPFDIVNEMIVVAPLFMNEFALCGHPIDDFFADGGLETKCVRSRTGQTEEALSLLADAAALFCDINPALDGIRIQIDDRFLSSSSVGTINGSAVGEIRGAILLSGIPFHFDMMCHQYVRHDFRIRRDPVTLDIAPSLDGGHEARLRRFFDSKHGGDFVLSQLRDNGKLAVPEKRKTTRRRKSFDRTSGDLFVIEHDGGGYALNWAPDDKKRLPTLYVLRRGRCLLPGSSTLEFGEALVPVAVEYEARSFPPSIFSLPDDDLRAAVIEHGARIYENPSPAERDAAQDTMDWLVALCAIHSQLGKGYLTIEINLDRNPGMGCPKGLEVLIHNGRYGRFDRYCDLLWAPIAEAVTKSGGLRPSFDGKAGFDGATSVRPAALEIEAGARFLANNDSGHARLELMSRASGPQWLSRRSRESILRAIEEFRS